MERIFGIGQKSRIYPRSKYPGTGFYLLASVLERFSCVSQVRKWGSGSPGYEGIPGASSWLRSINVTKV